MILEGKTIVVTGVGTGLGCEVARLALRDGANVVMGARTEKQLAENAKTLDPSGERIAWRPTDVTSAEDCQALAALALERFGAIDAAAQIAAYDNTWGPVLDQNPDQWRKAWDTNVIGALTLSRAVVPHMKKAGGGSIVLVGSQSMYKPQLEQAGYAASKGGLLTTMYYLAHELGRDRIRCNMVVPSWMWGPPVQMFVDFRAQSENKTPDEVKGEIAADMPLGEIVPDEDVAEAIVLLASDRARSITGQSLMVNGGEMLR